MTFLKKVGQILLEGLQIWAGFAPVVQAAIPGSSNVVQIISKDLTEIGNVVIQSEALGQALALPGAQKLTAAAGPVAQIILNSTLIAGKQIANPQLFSQGVAELTGAVADILNSLDPASVVTAAAVTPGAPPMTSAPAA